MTIDEIKELIQAVIDSGIAELEVEQNQTRVKIRRAQRGRLVQEIVLPSAAAAAHGEAPAQAPQPVTLPAPHAEATPSLLADPSLVFVKSPIVGTFYEAASPSAPPYVKVGDPVQVGQTLCIVEAMKLMNEIAAEVAGTVVSKLAANAQPVEYGEALFAIRPH